MPPRSSRYSTSSNLTPQLPSQSPVSFIFERCSVCKAYFTNMVRVGHRIIMRKCIVCNTPIPSNTAMEQVVAECRSANCKQPCIHRWLEINQNLNLCSVCKSVVGGNRFAPNFGSENTIDDNRNDVPPADGRTEASGGFADSVCASGLYWAYIVIFIIILAILYAVFFIF